MKKLLFLLLVTVVACGKTNVPDGKHPEWSYGAVMYELNTRQFTAEGTFAAAQKEIPRLVALGVDIVWFMPIHPIGKLERKGELGSYYSISDYEAVNPEFGTMADFKSFVTAAHAAGLKVMMDWVPNHTSRDAVWLAAHPEWYDVDEAGVPVAPHDWTDVAQLDFSKPELRRAMTDAMLYWIREADVDGFRCDYAVGPPIDYWRDAIVELKAAKSDLFMLAEAENPGLHTVGGFDASYAWEAHHLMNRLAKSEWPLDSLRSYLVREKANYPADAVRLMFTSNHDENSWNGTEFERMGEAARTFAALTYVLPGMPLVYNGQEVGLDRRLEFFVKDPIDWVERGSFGELYTGLNALKHNNPALAAGERGGVEEELTTDNPAQVFALRRAAGKNVVKAVFNLSPSEARVTADGREWVLAPWEYVIETE